MEIWRKETGWTYSFLTISPFFSLCNDWLYWRPPSHHWFLFKPIFTLISKEENKTEPHGLLFFFFFFFLPSVSLGKIHDFKEICKVNNKVLFSFFSFVLNFCDGSKNCSGRSIRCGFEVLMATRWGWTSLKPFRNKWVGFVEANNRQKEDFYYSNLPAHSISLHIQSNKIKWALL